MCAARQRRRGGLRAHAPHPKPQPRIAFRDPLELDEERGIVVARQQPKKEAIGEPKWPCIGRPPQLEQPAILEDRSDLLPTHRLRRRGRQEVRSPQSCVLLFPDDGDRFLVMQKLFAQRGYALEELLQDRKSTRLNSSHVRISYAVFCLKKKKKKMPTASVNLCKLNETCRER